MIEKQKQELINELKKIEQQIEDIKLEETPSYIELKELINKRERIKFRLSIWT